MRIELKHWDHPYLRRRIGVDLLSFALIKDIKNFTASDRKFTFNLNDVLPPGYHYYYQRMAVGGKGYYYIITMIIHNNRIAALLLLFGLTWG